MMPTLLLPLLTIVTYAAAALKNTTQEFHLRTTLKPNQPGKQRFNDLWIEGYHTGAGLDDAVFLQSKTSTPPGFLNGTRGQADGIKYQDLVFDEGDDVPWLLLPQPDDVFYAAWQPVSFDAAVDPDNVFGGFFINSTGLQWTTTTSAGPDSGSDGFGGWLVCDWWHGVPQLFVRLAPYTDPAPCSCADVWLCPEYF